MSDSGRGRDRPIPSGMTAVDRRPDASAPASAPPIGPAPAVRWWQAAWGTRLRAHLAALAVVLIALVPVIGTGASFSADEGAAIIQARSLADGRGWIVEHPLPAVDPDGRHYPLELSERGADGVAPFAKHPLYALMLAGADRFGGTTAMVALSLAGTLAAAGLAAALARRIGGPSLARPALWAVGLGSPLLLDGYLVIAHTLGAAAAAAAVLAAMVAIERRSTLIGAALVPPCIAAAVLLRNEAVFLALGLGVAAGLVALRGRPRLPAAAVAFGSVGAAALAHLGEALWTSHLVGGAATAAATTTSAAASAGTAAGTAGTGGGFLRDRVDGFVLTWLTPTYSGRPLVGLALLVMIAAVGFGAWSVRRTPDRRGPILVAAAVAAGAALIATIAGPGNVVPGLLVAFPLVAAGLILLTRDDVRPEGARLAAVTAGVFTLGVLATQYSTGGSGEWGGRYFALVIPVAVPVLLVGLARQRQRLTPATAERAAAGLVVCLLALTTMAVGSITKVHRFTGRLVDSVSLAAATSAPAPAADASPPVIITTAPSMPRLAWSTFDDQRWLLTTSADLADLAERVERFTFVTRNLSVDLRLLGGLHVERASGAADGTGWQVLVVGG